MDLVGMGEVSAEEILTDPAPDGNTAPYGPDATADMRTEAIAAIVALWPEWSESDANAMLDLLARNFGSLPEITVRTIKGIQWCVNNPPAKTEPTGPEFEEIVTPAETTEPAGNSTPTVEKTEGEATPTVENDDEVDIDAMFDAESQFLE
jgi:hypothetical protein